MYEVSSFTEKHLSLFSYYSIVMSIIINYLISYLCLEFLQKYCFLLSFLFRYFSWIHKKKWLECFYCIFFVIRFKKSNSRSSQFLPRFKRSRMGPENPGRYSVIPRETRATLISAPYCNCTWIGSTGAPKGSRKPQRGLHWSPSPKSSLTPRITTGVHAGNVDNPCIRN